MGKSALRVLSRAFALPSCGRSVLRVKFCPISPWASCTPAVCVCLLHCRMPPARLRQWGLFVVICFGSIPGTTTSTRIRLVGPDGTKAVMSPANLPDADPQSTLEDVIGRNVHGRWSELSSCRLRFLDVDGAEACRVEEVDSSVLQVLCAQASSCSTQNLQPSSIGQCRKLPPFHGQVFKKNKTHRMRIGSCAIV